MGPPPLFPAPLSAIRRDLIRWGLLPDRHIVELLFMESCSVVCVFIAQEQCGALISGMSAIHVNMVYFILLRGLYTEWRKLGRHLILL